MKRIKNIVKELSNILPQMICRYEFNNQKFVRFNERPIELSFIFKHIAKLYPKKILDVGAGATALPQLIRDCGSIVTAIDNVRDYWPSGMVNRHYYIKDVDITDCHLEERFDLITCISVLEHIEDSNTALKNMINLLNENGHLILSFPYTEDAFIENVYELPSSSYGQDFPFICRSYSRKEVDSWTQMNGCKIIEQEYWQCWTGDYWTAGDQVIPPLKKEKSTKHQLSCIILQK